MRLPLLPPLLQPLPPPLPSADCCRIDAAADESSCQVRGRVRTLTTMTTKTTTMMMKMKMTMWLLRIVHFVVALTRS
jgi:hypothetical protein